LLVYCVCSELLDRIKYWFIFIIVVSLIAELIDLFI
jgi:hypothetical protein